MKKIINYFTVIIYSLFYAFKASFKTLAHFESTTENEHFKKIHSKVMSLQHFEEDSFEDFDDFEVENLQTEYFENVERYKGKGMSSSQAERSAYNAMAARHGKPKANKAVRAGQPLRALTNGLPTSAIAVLTITRATATLNAVLPVPLFGAIHAEDGYRSILTGYLPGGVTLAITNSNGQMVCTYTDGTNTDVITVSCSSIPYLSLLKATLINMFRMNRVRYTISSSANTVQFDSPFDVVPKTMWGAGGGKNQVPISSFRDPKNQQSTIIDAPVKIDIDNETALVVGLNAVAQSVGLNINISDFNTRNRKKLENR